MCFMIFLISVGYSQNDYQKSHLNLSIGIGPNYGQTGMKAVIGFKNSGFLLGVGKYRGHKTYSSDKDIYDWFTAYEIGGQISYKWWYANLGYGVYGFHQGYWNDEPDKVMAGGIFITGLMINMGKNKRFFIDSGIGCGFGATYRDYTLRGIYLGDKTYTRVAGIIGFGIRL